MGLTWPIDTKEVSEIPELSVILNCFPTHVGLIKYVCYLYDPKNKVVREASTPAMKRLLAEEFAGITPPDPPILEEEPSPEFIALGGIATMLFRLLSNFELELQKSREIVLERMMEILRSVEEGADATKQITIWSSADKAIDDTLARYNALYMKLASDDEKVVAAMKLDRSRSQRVAISPEGRASAL